MVTAALDIGRNGCSKRDFGQGKAESNATLTSKFTTLGLETRQDSAFKRALREEIILEE
jgi:hypothetical protein